VEPRASFKKNPKTLRRARKTEKLILHQGLAECFGIEKTENGSFITSPTQASNHQNMSLPYRCSKHCVKVYGFINLITCKALPK